MQDGNLTDTIVAELGALTAENAKFRRETELLRAEIEALRQQAAMTEASLDELRQHVTTLQAELTELRAIAALHNSSNTSL